MTAPVRPASVKAFQREKWAFVPTMASQTAPTAAEVNAAGSLDISCYLFESSGRPTRNTNLVTRARRICDGALYQQVGQGTYQGGQLNYMLDPQAAPASAGRKAWDTMPGGTVGFLVRRLGIDVQTNFIATDKVDVFPVEFDAPMPTTEGSDDAAECAATQTFAITGPPSFLAAIV